MKNKKLALLSLGLVAAVAGVATSSAFLYEEAVKQQTGVLDQGIILDFDDENSDVTSIDSLTVGSYAYRKVTVKAPVKSEGLTGNVNVNFNLVQDDHIKVEILKGQEWTAVTDETDATGTLDNETADWTDTIVLDTFTTDVFYSLRVSAELTGDGETSTSSNSNGTITISLEYAA
ncbi:MAG: hypothetical protein IAA85_01730 [Firmicutes bacterium]|nr:hypothetical protein [Candidatus Alectryobacillus merdavium]